MALDDHAAQAEALQKRIHELSLEAHSAGTEMKTISDRLLEWGKLAVAGSFIQIVKDMAGHVKTQREQAQKILEVSKAQRTLEQSRLANAEELLSTARLQHGLDPQMLRQHLDAVDAAKKRLSYSEENVAASEAGVAALGRTNLYVTAGIALLEMEYALWKSIMNTTHLYQRALMQTTTDFAARFAILTKVAAVQAELGAKAQDVADATEALVEYGHDLTPAFQQNLKLVVMMKEALNISARTGAELVTIFTRQLQVAAQGIADVMAEVAANTSLAAEKAAQFAIEIGRSLRLFGPGVATQAAGITRLVETLAGKVNEIGGNAHSIIEMHRRLMSTEGEGFFMRGAAGASLTGLRTAAGTEQAMRNLADYLQARIGQPGGTEAEQTRYMMLVGEFGKMLHMSSNEIIDFMQSMDLLRNTTSKAVTIQDAWRKQTTLLGESFGKIKQSFLGVLEQAALPLLQTMTPLVGELAAFASHLAGLPKVIAGVRIAVEYAAKSFASMVLGIYGPSTAAFSTIAKYIPGLKNLDVFEGLKNMLAEWKADWTQETQKQQQYVLLSATKKSDTDVAVDKFVDAAMAKTDADRVKLNQQFVDALKTAAASEGATQEQIGAKAIDAFKSRAFTEMLQRGHTVKTEADRSRDKYFEVTNEQLNFLRLQYEQMKKDAAVENQKQAVEAQKAQEEHDRYILSHLISPEQLTQAPAYMIQRNVPSFHQ